MSEMTLRVGRKGEIYTTKHLREEVGIRAGSFVKAQVRDGGLFLRRARSLEELLEERRIASISVKEFERRSLQLQRGYAGKKRPSA